MLDNLNDMFSLSVAGMDVAKKPVGVVWSEKGYCWHGKATLFLENRKPARDSQNFALALCSRLLLEMVGPRLPPVEFLVLRNAGPLWLCALR